MTATVFDVKNGRPCVVAFRFDTPLEDPSLRWVDGDFYPWTPPEVGEQVSLGKELTFDELMSVVGSLRGWQNPD